MLKITSKIFIIFIAGALYCKPLYRDAGTNLCIVSFTYTFPTTAVSVNERDLKTEKTNIVEAMTNSSRLLITDIEKVFKSLPRNYISRKKLFMNKEYLSLIPQGLYENMFPVRGYRMIRRNRKTAKLLTSELECDLILYLDLDYYIRPVFIESYDNEGELVKELNYFDIGIQLFFDIWNSEGKRVKRTKVIAVSDDIDSYEKYLKKGALRAEFYTMHEDFLTFLLKKLNNIFR